jgi:hypothetical protein
VSAEAFEICRIVGGDRDNNIKGPTRHYLPDQACRKDTKLNLEGVHIDSIIGMTDGSRRAKGCVKGGVY